MADDEPIASVTPLRIGQEGGNLSCACGSEWWSAVVAVDQVSGRVTGHLITLTCTSCGAVVDWMHR
jgi:hypothetical protein